MKKLNWLLITVFCLGLSTFAQAQDKDKFWIGTGFGGLTISGSTFGVGLSPMLGYKVTDRFSVGARLPLDYYYTKLQDNTGEVLVHQDMDWGIGGISRMKLFWNIFAHAEYNQLFIKDPIIANGFFQLDPDDPTKLWLEEYTRNEFNVGLGYSNGGNGRLSYEVMLLYNTLEDRSSPLIPFSFRAGVNYNF